MNDEEKNNFRKIIKKAKKDVLEKEDYKSYLIGRIDSNLMFIEYSLSDVCPKLTGGLYNRSIEILFSYNFELILKLLIILSIGKEEYIKKLEAPRSKLKSHKLNELLNLVSPKKIEEVNIKHIEKIENNFKYYKITTRDEKIFTIQDFEDIRYDFTINKVRETKEEGAKELEETKKEFEIIKDIFSKARVA